MTNTPAQSTTEFAERMTTAIDGAGMVLLISLGHQTGLLDTMSGLGPATSAEIADAAGLNERYVREWLGGMTVAGVVDFDPAGVSYLLPADHAAVLTRAAGLDNLARLAQYIPLLAEAEQKLLPCFRAGGGLPYHEYPRFHAVMAERSGEVFDHVLVDRVLPLVAGLPQRLHSGIEVADFGCGSGRAINVMAQAFPESRFTGIDFSPEAVRVGVREAQRRGLTNAHFESHDLTELDKADAYDVITVFDAIHDQAQPARVLTNIHRALRPGGIFVMADTRASSRLEDNIGIPMTTFRYTVSLLHCMPVSLALDGAGLGTMWGHQQAVAMLADTGFDDVDVTEIDEDPTNYYYIARKANAPV